MEATCNITVHMDSLMMRGLVEVEDTQIPRKGYPLLLVKWWP